MAEYLPGFRTDPVRLLGEGEDHLAYEVGGELIVRFGKEPDPRERAERAHRDARLLDAVAGISPLPVPEPLFTIAEQGCLAYAKLPGVPLIGLSPPEHASASIAVALGGFLAALHRAPAALTADLVDIDDQSRELWLQEAAETYAEVADEIPKPHRPAIEAFLKAPPPPGEYPAVFSHNDLGIEHVLVDPVTWEVTGVIDWSDAAFTDPAYDLGLLYRDLGPGALDAALRAYHPGDLAEIRARAVFYARCAALEDLAYGLASDHDEYAAKTLSALPWLWPDVVAS